MQQLCVIESVCPQLQFVVVSFCSLLLTGCTGVTCRASILDRLGGSASSVLITPPLRRCLGPFPTKRCLCHTAACVCGSTNCCRFIRLHINIVSIEPTPAPLVALLVCLPVAAVTVEVERARWLRCPQQTYCCPCSHRVQYLWECLPCPATLCLHSD